MQNMKYEIIDVRTMRVEFLCSMKLSMKLLVVPDVKYLPYLLSQLSKQSKKIEYLPQAVKLGKHFWMIFFSRKNLNFQEQL